MPSSESAAWSSETSSPALSIVPRHLELNLLPLENLRQPLWRSLLENLRDQLAPPKLPPLQLTSRPVRLGMLLGDRLAVPWYRTIFTNVGDVIAPETLPPLELESRPVEVGELISDQLSHLWFSSLLRNLADAAVPEKLPPLQLSSEPDDTILPSKIMLFPRWSSVIETVRAFAPDETKPAQAVTTERRAEPLPAPAPSGSLAAELEYLRFVENDLRTDLRRSGLRVRIWIALAAAQALFVVASLFWIK